MTCHRRPILDPTPACLHHPFQSMATIAVATTVGYVSLPKRISVIYCCWVTQEKEENKTKNNFLGKKYVFFVIHTSNHCMAVFYVTLRTYCCSAITSMRACSLSVAGKFYKATPTYPLVVTQCALLSCLHFCICLFCLFSIPLILEPITTQL